MSRLANEVLRATDVLVRDDLRAIGLTGEQIEMVLESGLVDMNKVHATALDGLANLVSEETDKFTFRWRRLRVA